MAPNTALTNETICDLTGQPLDRRAASLLKAIDKLLTVGAYYSADHGQYRVVSEKSCQQILAAIQPDRAMAIEITAEGMMIRSQLVDPRHRNVRLLHELLVPLNIARFEISSELTPADLRQAIAALQLHKQNLGNTEGFQEIKIENLPDSVSTASRSVVRDNGEKFTEGDLSLEKILGFGGSDPDELSGDDLLSESEKLAREFMTVVGQVLENLELNKSDVDRGDSPPHPESSPDNIRALREALKRLIEVNPDPGDLARLIEHAKKALDLSHDPNSVDLVFSLLKTEMEKDSDWKYKAPPNKRQQQPTEYKLSMEQLKLAVSDLENKGDLPAEPRASARENYLGICFHLLGADPSGVLEMTLLSNLEQVIASKELTREDLNLCSAVVATMAIKGNKVVMDRVLPAFSGPVRTHRPGYLVKFWARLWEVLDPKQRAVVWPHLVSDLLLGLDASTPESVNKLWLAASELNAKTAAVLVHRLECTPALRDMDLSMGLWRMPPALMYPVHLALMKTSQAEYFGSRLHDNLLRQPPNALTEILVRSFGDYDPVNNHFYLALLKQGISNTMTPRLRRVAALRIGDALTTLPRKKRQAAWVPKAMGWLGKLDPDLALTVLARIRKGRKFFFIKTWPDECRELAGKIITAIQSKPSTKDGR